MRRALSVAEFERLMEATRDGPERFHFTGETRMMLYLTAAYVGLRRGRLTYRQVSERLDMGRTRSSAFFYMGYAIRR